MLKQWQDWHFELFRLHSRTPRARVATNKSPAAGELAANELLDLVLLLAGLFGADKAVRHAHLELLLKQGHPQAICKPYSSSSRAESQRPTSDRERRSRIASP